MGIKVVDIKLKQKEVTVASPEGGVAKIAGEIAVKRSKFSIGSIFGGDSGEQFLLKVENVLSPNMRIGDGRALLGLDCTSEAGVITSFIESCNVNITGDGGDFVLYANPCAIDAVEDIGISDSYEISFDLVLYNKNEREQLRKSHKIVVKLGEGFNAPQIDIFGVGAEYAASSGVRVAEFSLFYDPALISAGEATAEVALRVKNVKGEEIAGLVSMAQPIVSDGKWICSDGKYRFDKLQKGDDLKYDLLFDMSRIGNPQMENSSDKYTIEAAVIYSFKRANGSRESRKIASACNIGISRNRTLVELGLFVDNRQIVEDNSDFNWGVKRLPKGVEHKLNIRLGNMAQAVPDNGNSRIVVLNLCQTRVKDPEHKMKINRNRFQRENIDAGDYFRFTCNDRFLFFEGDAKNENCEAMRLSAGEYKDLKLKICSDDIEKIRLDGERKAEIDLLITLKLDYIVDKGGDTPVEELLQKCEDKLVHKVVTIKFKLVKEPAEEWLGLDFGTSAIVATYGTLDEDKDVSDLLLNLEESKKEILRRAYPQEKAKRADRSEVGSGFISSNISLNRESRDNNDFRIVREDKDFKKYSIWLSPSTGIQDILLPCLKTMMEYETIPNILSDNENKSFIYYIKEGRRQVPRHLYDMGVNNKMLPTEMANVSTLFEFVYKQLFNHYVKSALASKGVTGEDWMDNVNKIVLSVPNTYTPGHCASLKRQVYKMFPSLYGKYFHIVSESDAVACYYIYNKREICEKSNVEYKPANEERVLVFDMGAGTLDLTYFTFKRENGCQSVKIKGKMGVNRAGNYLDHLLAEILCDLLKKGDISGDDKVYFANLIATDRKSINDEISYKERLHLKEYIKESIKPLLNRDDETIPDYVVGDKRYAFWQKIEETVKAKKLSELNDMMERARKELQAVDSNIAYLNKELQKLKAESSPSDHILLNGAIAKKQKSKAMVIEKILTLEQEIKSIKGDTGSFAQMTVADIKAHPKFREYIRECTEEILDNFRNQFGVRDNRNVPRLPVDVIVFSGRSTSLMEIRRGVMRAAAKLGMEGTRYVDLGNLKYIAENELNDDFVVKSLTDKSIRTLKNVVAVGSIIYAEWCNRGESYTFANENLSARYGVILVPRNKDDEYRWVEMIGRGDSKVNQNGLFATNILYKGDISCKLYDVAKVLFVQSYENSPATRWREGKRDMTSLIAEYVVPGDIRNSEYKMEMLIDTLGDIHCHIPDLCGELTDKPEDDFNNPSLRKSLWPVLFR